jgi:hypothetical protein
MKTAFAKALYCTILSCFAGLNASSQKNDITLTVNPFSFIEQDAGFTPGIGYAVTDKISLLTDAGIIFYNPFIENDGGTRVTNFLAGYKIKPEFRYYPKAGEHNKGFFIGVELLYKHVRYNRYDGVQVSDNMGNIAYTDYSGYKIKKDVYGGSIKLGVRTYFNKNYRLGLDLFFGLGARTKNFAVRDLPPGGSFDRSFFSNRFLNPYWQEGPTLSLPCGAKLIYRLP